VTEDGLGELGRLAEAAGVQTSYWDTRGGRHVATPDAVVAVLSSLGAPIDRPDRLDDLRAAVELEGVDLLEPVVVHWVDGQAVDVDVCRPRGAAATPVRWVVTVEDGGIVEGVVAPDARPPVAAREAGGRPHDVHRIALEGTDRLPAGYHRLFVEADGRGHVATLVVAPRLVAQPAPAERTWGVVAPLSALAAPRPTGPAVADLDGVGRWIHSHGGRIVATLPILAAYLDEPCDFSPYTPVSRRFWNELYLDIEATPELAASPEARALVDALVPSSDAVRFDHRAHHLRLRPVLEALARTFFAAPASTRAPFEEWMAADPTVGAYAAFRAAGDQTRTGWHAWGVGAGRLPAGVEVDGELARYHLYVQWTMRNQLAAVAGRLASRDQRLYLDLPVGTHGDGFDTWAESHLYGWGCAVGAPPDDFFGEGQNWGFPPTNPRAARADGHRQLVAALRHHMHVAGVLRLDHVMGLERLYWVPDGAHAREGVYVRYPREELFAVLCVESMRRDCRIVGEDLGTVTDEIREAMTRHGLLGMYVSQFRLPGHDATVPVPGDRQVAAIDTHDTPTFAGWMQGLDIGIRRATGQIEPAEEHDRYEERRIDVARLVAALRRTGRLGAGDEDADAGVVLAALLEELAASPAAALLVGIDDLVLDTEAQNVPGTPLDRPNWVHILDSSLADLATDDEVTALLRRVQGARLSAHQHALEDPS
jgi:4-alpha-glucanotransferase